MNHPDWAGLPAESLLFPALPQSLRSFISDRRQLHSNAVQRVLRLYRWARFRPGGHRPVIGLGLLEWSGDGSTWHGISTGLPPQVEVESISSLTSTESAALQQLVDDAQAEPLAHDLFREAWQHRRESPRSSIILSAAALEIGVKRQIAHYLPAASWLVDKAPSPPVERMLAEYLPTLGEPSRWMPPPPQTMATIKKLVAARNGLAHAGAEPPGPGSLETMLLAVLSVLYALDYQRGHDWARPLVNWDGATATMGMPVFVVRAPNA